MRLSVQYLARQAAREKVAARTAVTQSAQQRHSDLAKRYTQKIEELRHTKGLCGVERGVHPRSQQSANGLLRR